MVSSQNNGQSIHSIKLPSELAFHNNQVSGMFLYNGLVFILPECRIQENHKAQLFTISTHELDQAIQDSSYAVKYIKHAVHNLDIMRNKMDRLGDPYEGLEALVIKNNVIYLSAETETGHKNCYLLKGYFNGEDVILDTTFLLTLPKFKDANNKPIYNAGYEAMTFQADKLVLFYEYNYFEKTNQVYSFSTSDLNTASALQYTSIQKLPFRITDITKSGDNNYVAINYFYNGKGKDEVYRVPASDTENRKLIKDKRHYKSYCRLIELNVSANGYSWKPIYEMPGNYNSYNWEGIAAYKNGYLMVNDKYKHGSTGTEIVYIRLPK